jgi:uncharacterized membrane protein
MSLIRFAHLPPPRARAVMRWVLAGFFILAGVAHLRVPDVLLAITPEWVPFPREVILATGVFELLAAAVLVFSVRGRAWAGVALAVYAICVWPANFKHAFEGIDIGYVPSSWWYHAPRLAMQPVIAWWALFSSGAIDWPWRR